MTTVSFLVEQARIVGFDVQGHSGWGQEGEDIVCAAVTSAIRLVECTVNDVMGLCASVKIREKDAKISFRLPGGLSAPAESTCQNLLTGLMLYLTQLQAAQRDIAFSHTGTQHIDDSVQLVFVFSCQFDTFFF